MLSSRPFVSVLANRRRQVSRSCKSSDRRPTEWIQLPLGKWSALRTPACSRRPAAAADTDVRRHNEAPCDPVNNDHIYWAFSAAAQSIAAFVAFLLTGFALVHTLMEAAREKDDTLEEVHAGLRQKYHARLARLAWVTGLAVILSLVTVFVNRWEFPYKAWLLSVSAAVDLVAIVGGLAFVVSVVNPAKYERAAAQELEDKKGELRLSGKATSATRFFEEFRHLEGLVRKYLRDRELYVPSRGAPRMSFSFRQMIEALLQDERIDSAFFQELMEINKYRNLVFHGHVEEADDAMVERVRAAAARIKELL